MTTANELMIKNSLRGRKVPPKFKPIPYPKPIERSYNSDLQAIAMSVTEQVRQHVLPILPSVARDLGQPTLKKDDGVDDVTKAINEIKKNLSRKYTDKELAEMARRKGISVAEYNKQATKAQFKRVLGVDLLLTNGPLVQQVSMFTVKNVSLSKSLMDDAVAKVEQKVLEGFSKGTRWEEIAKDIEEYIEPGTGGISNRARLIARDQISKLNGQVTSERQKSLGVNQYKWRGSLDERERDSHREKEGNTYRWDDPPADTGHPGDDFQCRCTAEPDLSAFFE